MTAVQNLNLLDDLAAIDRPTITLLDGIDYPMRTAEDFTLEEQVRLRRLSRMWERIESGENDLNERELSDLHATIDRFIRMLLADAPDEQLAALQDRHKRAILEYFWTFTQGATEVTEAETTGDTSSPNSSDTTVATPAAG